MSRSRLVEGALVLAGALVLSAALILGEPDAPLRTDQQAYNLLVRKKLDPGLLARDAVFRADPALLHVPWFLDLHAAVARRTGGDPEAALAWLGWPIGALYLAGHYALFRSVSGHPLPAALAAVGALAVRNSLGGEYWGFDGARSVATRTILAGLTPPLLLLFLRWRRDPSFPAYYLLLGLLFNVHPVSAYHLAQVTALVHLWAERLRPRALGQVGIGVALFIAGSLPYALSFFPVRDNVSAAAELALARAALDYRFPYLLYPLSAAAILSVGFHMALPVLGWLCWRWRSRPGETMAGLDATAVAALALGLGGVTLIQAAGVWLAQPYLDIQQMRAVRLVYPVLLCGLALCYARLLAGGAWRGRAIVAALVLASLVPPAAVIHAVSEERRAAVKGLLGIGTELPPAPPVGRDAGALPALWQWARRETSPGALFFTDDFDFRLATLRSTTTGSFKDGSFFFLLGSRPFVEWYRLHREVQGCRGARGAGCWFPIARRLGADFAVVDPQLSAAGAPADFEKVWERGDWAVWRRRGTEPERRRRGGRGRTAGVSGTMRRTDEEAR